MISDLRHQLEGVGLLCKPWQIVVLCQWGRASTEARVRGWGAVKSLILIKPGVKQPDGVSDFTKRRKAKLVKNQI